MVKLNIKGSNELKFQVEIDLEKLVSDLKKVIEEKLADSETAAPAESQRLIYAGKVLKDAEPLTLYKLEDNHTIHLIRGKTAGSTAASTPAPAATPIAAPAASPVNAANTASGMGPLPGPLDNPMLASLLGGFGNGNAGATPTGAAPAGMPNFNDPQFLAGISRMFSDPAMMQMITSMLPPQLAQTLQSPQIQAMMSNPALMMAATQMMGSMQQPGAQPAAQTTGTGAAAPGGFNLAALSQLMGNLPTSPAAQQPAATQQPPEEQYEQQLRQLQEMGFYNTQENIQALQMFNGSVEAALEYLFSRPRSI